MNRRKKHPSLRKNYVFLRVIYVNRRVVYVFLSNNGRFSLRFMCFFG